MQKINRNLLKIIVICGPTGIGKTSVSIQCAQSLSGEIISADSMQIYKYMNIGTAKPTREEQSLIPHHLIDIVTPDTEFDAAQFSNMARQKIDQLHQQKRLPIVAGGTGFYIQTLLQGLFRILPSDPVILERLKKEASAHSHIPNFLHERLKICDPIASEKIHPHDTFRLIRSLEIYEMTGIPISTHHHMHQFKDKAPFETLKIGLDMDRNRLYDRINQRVDDMIQKGFIDEVEGLIKMGYDERLKSMQSIGYRHMLDYIQGRIGLKESIEQLKKDTRRYAKRQLTWFRRDLQVQWIDVKASNSILDRIKQFILS